MSCLPISNTTTLMRGNFAHYLLNPIFWVSVFLLVLASFSNVSAQIFPEGNYKGTGFSVEKNGKVVFDNSQIHSFKSQLKITKISSDEIKFDVSVKLKPKANAAEISERKQDRFKVIWTTDTSGKLQNLHPRLKSDKTNFSFSNSELMIRTWVARHGVWETQYYKRSN